MMWQYTRFQFRIIDDALIGLHGASVLLHEEALVIQFGCCAIESCRPRVWKRFRSACACASKPWSRASVPLRLLQRNLVWPRIDLRQEVALLNHLAFLEPDLGQLAVDLGQHGHGVERGDGAELVQDYSNIALVDGGRRRPAAAGFARPGPAPARPAVWAAWWVHQYQPSPSPTTTSTPRTTNPRTRERRAGGVLRDSGASTSVSVRSTR